MSLQIFAISFRMSKERLLIRWNLISHRCSFQMLNLNIVACVFKHNREQLNFCMMYET